MSIEIAYGSILKTQHFCSLKYLIVDSAVYIGTLFERNKNIKPANDTIVCPQLKYFAH